MGAYVSYMWRAEVERQKEVEGEGAEEKGEEKEEGVKKLSDPSYTIQYPPQEADFLKQVEEKEEVKNRWKLPDEQWKEMSPSEKNKYKSKVHGKKYKKQKRIAMKQAAQESKLNELRPWLDQLTPQQRALVTAKKLTMKPPSDPTLLNFLKGGSMVQCPNRLCSIFFEKMEARSSAALPSVLGENGKPVLGELLMNYIENRFRCMNCEVNFCVACGAIPYHLGETCEQYKVRNAHPPCRVCKKALPAAPDKAAKPDIVCGAEECVKMVYYLCPEKLDCGHACNAAKGSTCFCLQPACAKAKTINQNGDELCNICWTDELSSGTCTKLNCGHVFHRTCIEQKLRHRWTGARISFNFANCPLCSKPMEITQDYPLSNQLRIVNDLQKELKIKALHFLQIEGMVKDVNSPKHKFHGAPTEYAMDVLSFYMCAKCSTPYYGGKRQCGDVLNFDPEELVCGGCSGLSACEKHGNKYIHYKCRFCCSVASWFCFGLVHYCERCHSNPYEYWASNNSLVKMPPQCSGKEKCPLGIDHPPNGFEEMSLGCFRCKMEEAGIMIEDDETNIDLDY